MGKESIIYGRRVVQEVLNSKIKVESIYISKNVKKDKILGILEYAKKKCINIKEIYNSDMDVLCDYGVHQGIAIKISEYKYFKINEIIDNIDTNSNDIVLILDSIQDPRNLGSILRTAEIMGIKNVIIPQKRSCGINSTVWKASMGSLAYLNICRINNIINVLSKFKNMGFKIVATSLDSTSSLCDINYNFPLILIIGNEEMGIGEDLLNHCDIKIKIPMYGNIDSFNVSVAAGIIMYEIKNIQSRY
ncbi:RNA methyltransferase, TrmH family, group 3 [Candidatus Arthromitus sp. SFB-mouse-Japan]|uniref:23S rRNA (guanosine(2251)-2'-O)-methyltransferase RlmB n=1 Tax=unclassified Candidatus Neoarthromitus TaxID=2638829 RepID=UPI00021B8162|nr:MULTISPECIES: 23S rRNA (guanosine(2251)-2'-O)-methyltransferase RlmB [unclassified Candidatus Arthromitus]EIA22207.1 hypothetical protein SFB2_265G1 [Candidatus Arthromitus sp. SFB-2]EIA25075.1 tRNA/rRNA methyltransferase [Candidatus Arthromitus sp. SFB-1]EIA26644.1 Putative RNA methyltransferase [Candidatus Arthromitus sp. SFB-4]EIA27646.1 SpoU rRNA Methylase family protein [Candidatus Arthromitus sp. SFB-co]EIA29664.1 tRNA/rRNA methyltransferase (SpoU) domain protein [Candidatus Arthromit